VTDKETARKKLQVKNDKYRENYDRIFLPENRSVVCPHCHKVWTVCEDTNALLKCLWCENMIAVRRK